MTTNVYQFLDSYHIPYVTHEHDAVFTVSEAEMLHQTIPGIHTKNLFLKNPDGSAYYLLTLASHKRANLKFVAQEVGEKKLQFGTPEELERYLHLTPGSVSALGLIHDSGHNVRFLIDSDVWESDLVTAHPNINTATLVFINQDFRAFTEVVDHVPAVLTCE